MKANPHRTGHLNMNCNAFAMADLGRGYCGTFNSGNLRRKLPGGDETRLFLTFSLGGFRPRRRLGVVALAMIGATEMPATARLR